MSEWGKPLPMSLDELAPGVRGYTMTHPNGSLWIPVINADRPGCGDVGRYLDALPRDRTVVVPNVINIVLAGMLGRRGFEETPALVQMPDGTQDVVDIWIREAVER